MSFKKFLELLIIRRIIRKRRRSMYIRPIFENRFKRGEMFLVEELSKDVHYHQRYFRMNKESFDFILERIEHRIQHPQTHRLPISPKMRLAITLRYLATGHSHVSLALSFRISPSAVGIILRETLHAIWEEMKDDYMSPPETEEEWNTIAQDYETLWNFPHCVGTMDDAHYKIRYVDIGAPGSQSDSAILEESCFGKKLYNQTLPTPTPKKVSEHSVELPYVFLGDGGFQLRPNLLIPYTIHSQMPHSHKIFNLRLSRARRISENVFGILVARWRIFKTEIEADRDLAVLIVKASTILHNYLMSKRDLINITLDQEQDNGQILNGNWREYTEHDTGYGNIRSSNNYSRQAREIRDSFSEFFLTPEGSVPWQERQASRGYDINEM